MELVLFLLLGAAVLLAPSFLVPRAWMPVYALVVLYAVVFLWVGEQRANCASCGGPGQALGLLFGAVLAACFLGIGARFAWMVFRPVARLPSTSSKLASQTTAVLCAAGLAVLSVYFGVLAMAAVFDSGWLTHLAVLLWAACWLWLSRRLGSPPAFGWTGVFITLGLTGWSLWTISDVARAADKAAQGKPYCMLTSTAHGLRAPRSALDLSGFMMQADRGSFRHAVLFTGDVRSPEWQYWSYRGRDFQPEFASWPVACESRPAYADSLALWPGATGVDPADQPFWLARGRWHIPREYGGSGSDGPPRLVFYAQGADFGPPPASVPVRNEWTPAMMEREVSVSLCTPSPSQGWLARSDANREVELVGQVEGLDKLAVRSRSSGREEFQFVRRDGAGQPVTWLSCDAQGGLCRHAFTREGVAVEFRHPRGTSLSQWSELEDAAWLRIRSFAVVWPDKPAQPCR